MKSVCLLVFSAVLLTGYANASTITYTTPTGSSVPDGSVDAQVVFSTSTGFLTVTLSDLLVSPTSVGQLISDLQFTLGGSTGTYSLTSSSAQQITIASNGTATIGATGPTGWGFGTLNSSLYLCIICDPNASLSTTQTGQPSMTIIGPGPYTSSNSSITGNGPHNPFLNQTATFTISDPSITSSTTVTSATFSFGTTPGVDVPGTPGPKIPGVPEPASMALMGGGLIALGVLSRRRFFSRG